MPSTRPGTSVDLACGLFWHVGHESVACVEKGISSVAAEPGFVHLKNLHSRCEVDRTGHCPSGASQDSTIFATTEPCAA